MHLFHGQILAQIQMVSKKSHVPSKLPDGYGGNDDFHYGLTASQRKDIVQNVLEGNKKMRPEDIKKGINSLYKTDSSDEKYCAGIILQKRKDVREIVEPGDVDKWLSNLKGWAEVDSLCQSVFTKDDYVKNWKKWKEFIIKLSKDKTINKRRASLVLLVKPVRDSADEVFSRQAFENIDRLKYERDKLITKAISWLLRTLIKHHRDEVESYLVRNQKSLPAIAVRETRAKLLTGRK